MGNPGGPWGPGWRWEEPCGTLRGFGALGVLGKQGNLGEPCGPHGAPWGTLGELGEPQRNTGEPLGNPGRIPEEPLVTPEGPGEPRGTPDPM